ncbi:MAG: GNAT family N-acetyltransferase [Leptospirales bacterium]
MSGEEDNDEFGPWLARVYTIPSVRRFGFATALVRHAEKQACLMGFERILLTTPRQKSYETLGWLMKDRTKYGEHVMEKKVRSVLRDMRKRNNPLTFIKE